MPSTSAAPKPLSPQEMMGTQDLQLHLRTMLLEYDQARQDQCPGLCGSGTTHGLGGPGIQR